MSDKPDRVYVCFQQNDYVPDTIMAAFYDEQKAMDYIMQENCRYVYDYHEVVIDDYR